MTDLPLKRANVWLLSTILVVTLVMACSVSPVQPVTSSQTTSSSAQFSATPAQAVEPASIEETTSIINPPPPTISATITLSNSGNVPVGKGKGDAFLLENADTAINQLFGEWLATTSVTMAELTPELRAASPTITVTLILEDESVATAIKEVLPELDALLLAEAGTMLAIQLPVGLLDQLAQMDGVLLIQTPAAAPPMSHAPTLSPVTLAPTDAASPLFMQATSGLPDAPFSTEKVDAWANSIALDGSELHALQVAKLNQLPLADSAMNYAYQNWYTAAIASTENLPQAAWSSELITVTLLMQDEAAAIGAQETLSALNIAVLDSYATWLVVAVPVGQLQPLMELPGLLFAQQPTRRSPLEDAHSHQTAQIAQEPAYAEAVALVTEGVARSKVNVWHSGAFRGQNVRVAIVDGFDQAIINDAFAKKELPTKVLNGPSEAGVDHGVAVAEVVFDMAPQANISLHSIGSAPDFCIAMANTLENIAKQGNQIISSSISPSFCPSPGNGATNPISQAATRLLNTYNTLYLQAAGNNALHHHERAFNEVEEGDTLFHNFASNGEATVNVMAVHNTQGPQPALVPVGTRISLYLRWDGGWPRSSQDYDLYLVYYDGSQWRFPNCTLFPCRSENLQSGSQPPYEAIDTLAPFTGYYGVVITKYDADGNHFLDLLGGHTQPPFTHFSPSRSLIPAATSQDVFSIAAVDVNSLNLESYSSRGPTYGPGNSPNGGFAQPRMAGYANVTTYAIPGFNGTSSATPHVAGAAAVVKSAATCLSARQLGDWLAGNSLDRGTAGYDSSYGTGVLNFPALSARPRCYPNQNYMPSIQN